MYFSLFLESDWFITNAGYDCACHLRDETLSDLQGENKNGATQLMVQKADRRLPHFHGFY